MSNFKEQVELILKGHIFVESEFNKVFMAMSDILYLASTQLEENEPHAKRAIDELKNVSHRIDDMDYFIETHTYEK